MKASTDGSVSPFIDWHNYSRIDHNLSNDEILARFGNDPRSPDTNAATYISWWEIPAEDERLDGSLRTSSQKFYKDLDLYNSGLWTLMTRNDSYETYRQKRDLIEMLSSQLELNREQRSRVRAQYLSLDLSKQGVVMELVAFALCAYAVHADSKRFKHYGRKCHPQTPAESTDPLFTGVLSYFVGSGTFSKKEFEQQYGKVQYLFNGWVHELPQGRVGPTESGEEFDRFGVDERKLMQYEEVEKEDAGALAEMCGTDLELDRTQSKVEMGGGEGVYKGLRITLSEEPVAGQE
jgi:hypothetical protein